MARDFVPWEYQQVACQFMLRHKRCSLWAGMGLGKSSASLMVLDALELMGLDTPTLILGPLRVARDTWPTETQKWNQFGHIEVVPVVGSPEQRKAALKRPAKYYSMNYDNLPWLVELLGQNWPFKMVIADEATRLKGHRIQQGGQRAGALAEVAHTLVDRWINLTGTPAPNGYQDLWGQQWFVDRGSRLGLTHTAFSRRWFQRSWTGHGMDILPHAQKEINEKLADCCLTLDPKDWFKNLKEPRLVTVSVQLPAKAREIYKKLEAEMFAQLESGTGVEVFNAASLSSKCCQLANGAVYTTHPEWEEVHARKIEALESIVGESGGMPLLVSHTFKSDRARILKHFGKAAADISTDAGLKAFKAGDIQVGLAHPASMGHGIDGLQDVTCRIARFSRTWNLEHEQQMLERIGPVRQLQSGHDRLVEVFDIVAEDTVDELLVDRLALKRGAQDALLAYMKGKR